jgi:hypothetical protein
MERVGGFPIHLGLPLKHVRFPDLDVFDVDAEKTQDLVRNEARASVQNSIRALVPIY